MKKNFSSLKPPAVFLLFAIAGVVLARLPLSFLFGIQFVFLNALTWYVCRRYSVWQAAAVAFIGSAFAVALYGQSPLLFLSLPEILLVGFYLRRRNRLILADFTYSLTAGPLLYGIGYWLLHHGQAPYLTLFLLFQAGNGMLNAVIGDMAADYLAPRRCGSPRNDWRMGRVLLHLSLAMAIVPLFIFLVISSLFLERHNAASVAETLRAMNYHVNDKVNQLSRTERRDLLLHSALQKAYFQQMFADLTTDSTVELILLDENGKVFAAGPALSDEAAAVYEKPLAVSMDGLYLQQPDDAPVYNRIERWSKSAYVSVFKLSNVPFTLISRQPVAQFQKQIYTIYSVSMGIVYLLACITAALALIVTRKLHRSLAELGKSTTGLPEKIKRRRPMSWSQSSFFEINILMRNFVGMAEQLSGMFEELQHTNEMLAASEHRLKRIAHYDMLTGLQNRYSFVADLTEWIAVAQSRGERIVCLFIDLDRFKTINDTYGHEAGDAVLKAVGNRLAAFRSDRVGVYRLAGDEFVVAIREPLPAQLEIWANTIHRAVSADAVLIGETEIGIALSVGLSIFPDNGADLEGLLGSADKAMYAAKSSGRNRVQVFSED